MKSTLFVWGLMAALAFGPAPVAAEDATQEEPIQLAQRGGYVDGSWGSVQGRGVRNASIGNARATLTVRCSLNRANRRNAVVVRVRAAGGSPFPCADQAGRSGIARPSSRR